MKKIVRVAMAAAVVVAFSGCAAPGARTAMLTYDSMPVGATIYENGKALGVAPVVRTYQYPDGVSSIATPEVTAVWVSGAKNTYWTNLPVFADLAATIQRPANVPGLEQDQAAAQPIMEARAREAERLKEENQRTMARDSPRCREQQKKGIVAGSDC
jgi:hypothetical protein